MGKIRIQIVEDDSITAQYIKKSLESYGYEVLPTVIYAEDAINAASEKKPDLFLMDINLGGKMDGIDATAKINRLFGVPVHLLTAETMAEMTNPYRKESIQRDRCIIYG